MIPSDVQRWSGVLLLLLLLLFLAPTAKACLMQHSHSGIVSISDGIPGSIYLHPGQNFSLLSLNLVMESMTNQQEFNKTIFLREKSEQLAKVWHRMDIFPPKNESDYPRMTIPPSNETWALICCRGYEIRELRADTLGFALWSYKCPNNSLGQLFLPDDYHLQEYVTFIVSAILVLVAVAVTMTVPVMVRQKRCCLSAPSVEPYDCRSADENADGEEQVPTDAPRPRTSSAAARGVPPAESHYLAMTSPPVIDEDESGYVILMSKQQKAKTTKKETATMGYYANVQAAGTAEHVYEELRVGR